MSSRKKSTSSEQTSSGSSSGSSSSSSSSGSETGSSGGSESDSSSSTDPGKVNPQPSNQRTQNSNNNNAKNAPTFRRKSAEIKPQNKQQTIEEKPKPDNTKTKTAVNRGQRLSKSSVYSSEEEPSPVKKTVVSKTANQPTNKRNFQYDNKKVGAAEASVPPTAGGKAPPSVVKQQQQQSAAKSTNIKQQPEVVKTPLPKSKTTVVPRQKNRSIFSPVNSSDSDEKKKIQDKIFPKANAATKPKPPAKPKPKAVIAKKQNVLPPPPPAPPTKKEERKRSMTSETATSTEEESSTNSSSHSEESDSSSHSSPLVKKPTASSQRKCTNTTRQANKSNEPTKTVILSDSDGVENRRKQQTVRKLTRSSSTRKSKHLTGKPSDTDSDIEIDKSRSISKSPVKKATTSNVNVTKSKTKAKKSTDIQANTFVRSISPVLEPQKCPVEGCDSSGHLSGNHNKHFLPDACPIYHNMSMSECKDRAVERKIREEEKSKIIAQYDAQNSNVITPEQKIYLTKIRDARARFKPAPSQNTNANDKMKGKQILDKKREPNLIGLVPDYDYELFREAQAIASEKIETELKDLPVASGIKYISMGKHQMKVWYQSPYPEDVAGVVKMYICEFCLRYKSSEISMKRHSTKCVWRHPPGDEIYRKGKLQVWQVDGKKYKQFCQLLCLLAKFFLDHKTLYYEVEPFLFYVMTLANYEGCHIVGYFSKEKNSFLNYNVSCILTLPPYQRKGYGRLLIDFSYLLTRVEGKIGSPEKPLSDLGLISYRSYWKDVLLDFLCTRTGTTLSIKDLSQEMAIYSYDIVSTLQALGMMKYWKGKHIVLKKQDVLEEYEERIKRRGNFPKIDASCLRWTPFIPPQTTGST